MIDKFVRRFDASRGTVREQFFTHPQDYLDIVKMVVRAISDEDEYDDPDPERIHVIDDGDYQGTLLYVIASKGYQPDAYWYVKVSYGSCSGCDTLQGIHEYSSEPPTESQKDDYMTLALHIVQGLRSMQESEV